MVLQYHQKILLILLVKLLALQLSDRINNIPVNENE